MNVVDAVSDLVSSNTVLREQVETLKNRCDSLEKLNEDMQSHACDCRRFYNSTLTTAVVAELHSVSPELVRKYVRMGMIPTHPMSCDAKILIRASDALLLDFVEMKRKMLYSK